MNKVDERTPSLQQISGLQRLNLRQFGLCWFQVPQIILEKLGKTPELLEYDGK